MKKNYKIVVVGLGYVGLSNAVLLAQHNEVIGVDISQDRVDALNARKSPIIDFELAEYLANVDLNLSTSTNLRSSLAGADYVIVSTPTNYDENTNCFDTSSVEEVIAHVIESEPNACIVVKSTIPVGYVDDVRERFQTDAVIFSPEFLREGKALHDNLYPSRIIVGEKSERAEIFAKLLERSALKANVEILLTDSCEAEAIKLFSNTYLAMRVAFFNELDSYALAGDMNSREIIDGVSLDPRIGNYYNNPSFGYGGYCLPKDTKQLLANFGSTPQQLVSATITSNNLRKKFLLNKIMQYGPRVVGVHRLGMKSDSDNWRESSVLDIILGLKRAGVEVIIYEPDMCEKEFMSCVIKKNIESFAVDSDLIIANRLSDELKPFSRKIFSRDLFYKD